MNHPDNMWPNGHLRSDASLKELEEELAWQIAWRKEARAVDHNDIRGAAGTDNINIVRAAIARRKEILAPVKPLWVRHRL